ncbi:MAG: FtsW/RodA/SpoVE family cell cycle protein [Lentisphaeria bacterium]|nr:FtsW/RodA/SpoVE family cell cycle protein [Lentisphaeria bacterium]
MLGRQVLWLGLGVIAFLLVSGVRERCCRRLLPFMAGLAYAALVLVLLWGVRINGMRGWFAWRGCFLQPSELAKPVFLLGLAWLLERTEGRRESWLRGSAPLALYLAVWALPIVLQPDFGTLLVYVFTFFALAWAFGQPLRHVCALGAAAAVTAFVAVARHPYISRRFQAFVDPAACPRDAGWHLIQFRRTLASGGAFGRSWESGLWAPNYLPYGYSDSVFASTAEKVGFFGILPLILLIFGLMAYGHAHACRTRSRFRAAVVFGVCCMIAAQALIHLSVNLGLMPPTGITLPLVSYGGSSLLASLVAFGLAEAMIAEEERQTCHGVGRMSAP